MSAPEFIKDCNKLNLLIKINEILNINKHKHNKLIFVYSAPKVGSTSIVSSLRLFGINYIDVIHIHDEEMLKVLAHIKDDITIKEIILFNKYLGKDVYVINVYRNPIEKKISTFFEKIGSYHFNNTDEKVNGYNLNKVMTRFNNIFPWIANGDHFVDVYDIPIPQTFDFNAKHVLVCHEDIKYISLRLSDSAFWGGILSNLLGFNLRIVPDYESNSKPIKDLYAQFKQAYKIPTNLLQDLLQQDKHLNYYLSPSEIQEYQSLWLLKSSDFHVPYSLEQYHLYETITIENSHIDTIQQTKNHYLDEGCTCKACNFKRQNMVAKIVANVPVTDRVIHTEAKTELIRKRVVRATTYNNMIRQIPGKFRGKDFKRDMSSIVANKYKF